MKKYVDFCGREGGRGVGPAIWQWGMFVLFAGTYSFNNFGQIKLASNE